MSSKSYKERQKKNSGGKIFQEIMGKNFPHLMKDINLQITEQANSEQDNS